LATSYTIQTATKTGKNGKKNGKSEKIDEEPASDNEDNTKYFLGEVQPR